MAYTYPAMVAWDSISKLAVKSTSFQVYAVADTGFVTPLAITDTFGNAITGNILNSGTIGVFPEFKQSDNATVVITDAARNYVWTVIAIQPPTQDSAVAGFVNTAGSATRGALDTRYHNAANLTGLLPEASVPARLTETALSATYVQPANLPQRAPYLAHEEKLSGWHAALANRATAPAQVVVFGDSISEGTGNSTVLKRWITRAQAKLRYRYSVTGGADLPFIPAVPKTGVAGFPVTRSGSFVVDSTYGLGWRTAILTAADGLITFTFTGTSAKLMYFKASGTGVMKIVVDGGAPVVVDTNSTRNPPAGNGTNTWDTGALSVGVHTVAVSWDSTSTQNVYIMGCFTYNGDETSGVRVLDGSYHGISSTFLTAARNTQASNSMLACGTVGLVVIAIETNDFGNATALATYKANLEAFITALRTGNALYKGTILLMSMYKADNRDEATWNGYAQQMKDIAAADQKAAFFDLRLRMPDMPAPFDAPSALGLYADTLHPNDTGSEWLGSIMADYLSLRGTPALTATKTSSYTILATDTASFWLFNGSSITATLPDPTTVASNAKLTVKNVHSTSLTVNSAGTSKTLDGGASQALAQWAKATYVSDGAQWLTV